MYINYIERYLSSENNLEKNNKFYFKRTKPNCNSLRKNTRYGNNGTKCSNPIIIFSEPQYLLLQKYNINFHFNAFCAFQPPGRHPPHSVQSNCVLTAGWRRQHPPEVLSAGEGSCAILLSIRLNLQLWTSIKFLNL